MLHLPAPLASLAHRIRFGMPRDPSYSWLTLLSLAALVLVALIVWSIWVFDTIAGGGSIGHTATSTPVTFNHSSLEMVNTVFEERATEESKYVTGVYHYSDPSQ